MRDLTVRRIPRDPPTQTHSGPRCPQNPSEEGGASYLRRLGIAGTPPRFERPSRSHASSRHSRSSRRMISGTAESACCTSASPRVNHPSPAVLWRWSYSGRHALEPLRPVARRHVRRAQGTGRAPYLRSALSLIKISEQRLDGLLAHVPPPPLLTRGYPPADSQFRAQDRRCCASARTWTRSSQPSGHIGLP
jgi:hypothetical protein